MSRRIRNLAITVAAPLVAMVLIWSLVGSDRSSPSARPTPELAVSASPSEEAPVLEEVGVSERLYSIPLYRLNGLSPATLPGTGLEIWVSWSEEVLDQPKLQRLIRRVTLEKIEAGPTPESPTIVTLRMPEKEIPDLIWGELFGELAVAARPN